MLSKQVAENIATCMSYGSLRRKPLKTKRRKGLGKIKDQKQDIELSILLKGKEHNQQLIDYDKLINFMPSQA